MIRYVPLTRPRTLAVAAGAALLAAAVAMAGEHGPGRPEFPISLSDAKAQAAERFQALDSDGSGELSPTELADIPWPWHGPGRHRGHGFARWQARADEGARAAGHEDFDAALFARLDADGNGTLSKAEFASSKLQEARREALRARVFAHLDADGSGGLSREEVPDPSRWLEAMDSDGDGIVTRDEARAHRPDWRGHHGSWHTPEADGDAADQG